MLCHFKSRHIETDVLPWLTDQFMGILAGIIISLIVYFLTNLLPVGEELRYKATFYRRRFSKFVLNPIIDVFYTVKTRNLAGQAIIVEDFISRTQENLTQDGFSFKGRRGNDLLFDTVLGKTQVDVKIALSYGFEGNEDEGDLRVQYAECDFKLVGCRYRSFDSHLLDLIQVFRQLEAKLEGQVGRWVGESLTCEVKRLYEFVGVLKELNMSSLEGKIDGQYQIELLQNKLVVYGGIEAKMTSMVKDIITYYY